MEKTLIIFKPDAVQRGIVGEVLTRFERAGLKIAGMKMLTAQTQQLHGHYEGIGRVGSRHGQEILDMTITMMQRGPVIATVLEGVEAIALVRKMVGATEPKAAAPGTIRGDYAHMSYGHADKQRIGVPNIVHASADEAEAKAEIAHWFSEAELHDYEAVHETHTQPKKK